MDRPPGPNCKKDADILGYQAEWQAARQAVTDLLERRQQGSLDRS